jgi:hypothetical protein
MNDSIKKFFSNSKYYLITIVISLVIGSASTFYLISKGSETNINRLQAIINDQSGTVDKLQSENSNLTKSISSLEQSNKQFEQINAGLRVTIKDLQGSSGSIISGTGELQKDLSSIKEREQSAINKITGLIIKSEGNGTSK